MFKRIILMALILGLGAILLTAPMVYSQGLTIVSKSIKGDIPKDPLSPAWKGIEGTVIPMSSQIIAEPRAFNTPLGMSSVRRVEVKSVNNGEEIAFLLEWDDATNDPAISVGTLGNSSVSAAGLAADPRSDAFSGSPFEESAAFRDAAAIEFPVTIPKSLFEEGPHFAMGNEGAPVNIWQWKADLEDGRDRAVPLGAAYPGEGMNTVDNTWYRGVWYDLPKDRVRKGPVEDLIAVGFSTISLQDSQDVNGKGIWSGGKRSVVIYRQMVTKDKEDAKLAKGTSTPIAFAIWDGSNEERDGMKSITTWHQFKIE